MRTTSFIDDLAFSYCTKDMILGCYEFLLCNSLYTTRQCKYMAFLELRVRQEKSQKEYSSTKTIPIKNRKKKKNPV